MHLCADGSRSKETTLSSCYIAEKTLQYTPVCTAHAHKSQPRHWPTVDKLSVKMDKTKWHLLWRGNRGRERGSSRWGRGESPLRPTQQSKTKHWWLLIWTSSAAKIKSQGPWLQCWGWRQHFNKTSKAKWNPGRILLFVCWTKSCTTVFLSICREKFDECQLSLALGPHPCFIHSSFLPLVPVFSWMKLTLVEGGN